MRAACHCSCLSEREREREEGGGAGGGGREASKSEREGAAGGGGREACLLNGQGPEILEQTQRISPLHILRPLPSPDPTRSPLTLSNLSSPHLRSPYLLPSPLITRYKCVNNLSSTVSARPPDVGPAFLPAFFGNGKAYSCMYFIFALLSASFASLTDVGLLERFGFGFSLSIRRFERAVRVRVLRTGRDAKLLEDYAYARLGLT